MLRLPHGKQVQFHVPGPGEVKSGGRLKRELATALALAPGNPDLLAAKGALLTEFPWFLGGDAKRGKELLRAALSKDPDNVVAHRYLSEKSD